VSYEEYLSYFQEGLLRQFGDHLAVVLLSTLLGSIVGVSAGILVRHQPGPREIVLKVAGTMLTIPSLALYAVLIGILGLGWPPVLLALTAYSLLPIIQNTIVGLNSVSASVLEAARGIGMGDKARLLRVELPLAWPVILVGIRTAAIILVSTAALGAVVRGPGLGNAIYAGLNSIGSSVALYQVLTGIGGVVVVGLLLNAIFFALARLTIPSGIRD
jgi:osmoprotectant transport system permease protein